MGSKPATNTEGYGVTSRSIFELLPDPKQLEGIPTDPKSDGPFVMWKGTPYAHIMVPVQ